MILQALKEYYERKVGDGSIAPDGWIKGGIDFLLSLDIEGNIIGISDLRETHGKKKVSHILDVPNIGKQALKHTNSGKDANLLWDNASFVLGLGGKGDTRLKSMIEAIDQWLSPIEDEGIIAVRKFLEKGLTNRSHFDFALNHPDYGEELREGNAKLSFSIPQTGLKVVFDSKAVLKALEKTGGQDTDQIGTCLVTGDRNVPIEVTHPVTKGVWGAQTSGACIVSFNKDSFNSYNKTQSYNAPVSKVVASQYG